jgi:hypothetical protein
VSVTVFHPNHPLTVQALPIVECQALTRNIQALLGRDFLSLYLFVYDGQAQRFALAF